MCVCFLRGFTLANIGCLTKMSLGKRSSAHNQIKVISLFVHGLLIQLFFFVFLF